MVDAGQRLSHADLLAFDPAPRRSGGQERFKCPIHGGDHQRSLSVNPDTGAYYCHNCGARGVLSDYAKPPAAGQQRGRRKAFIPKAAWRPAPRGDPDADSVERFKQIAAGLRPLADSPAAEYLAGRGISFDTARAAKVKFHPDVYGHPAACFAIRDADGRTVALASRAIGYEGPKNKRSIGPKSHGVFATAGALDAAALAITEAPIDALSLAQASLPAIALCGVSAGTCWPDWLPKRLRFRTVYIAFDADAAGDSAPELLTAALQAYGATVQRLRPPEGVKDWNEALQRDGALILPEITHQEARTARLVPSDVSEDPPIRDICDALKGLLPEVAARRQADRAAGCILSEGFYVLESGILRALDEGRLDTDAAEAQLQHLYRAADLFAE